MRQYDAESKCSNFITYAFFEIEWGQGRFRIWIFAEAERVLIRQDWRCRADDNIHFLYKKGRN